MACRNPNPSTRTLVVIVCLLAASVAWAGQAHLVTLDAGHVWVPPGEWACTGAGPFADIAANAAADAATGASPCAFVAAPAPFGGFAAPRLPASDRYPRRMPSAHLATLAGRDRARIAASAFAILPVGSLEFHGDHAPFGTDTTLAEGFAAEVAARRACLVLPSIAYAYVPPLTRDHGPGLSVPPDVFLGYLTAVLCGAADAGIRRVLVLNGHSENQYALRLAAEAACERQRDLSVLLVNWWPWVDRAPDGAAARAFGEGGGHGHGGPLEISVTAAFDARGVVPAAAEADIAYEAPWWRGRAQVVGLGQAPEGFAGYHGRVGLVDAEVGRRVVAQVADRLAELVDGWLKRARGAAETSAASRGQAGARVDSSDQLG